MLFSTNQQEGTSTTLPLILLGTCVPLEVVNQKSLESVALLATDNSVSFITGLIPGVQFHYRGIKGLALNKQTRILVTSH